MKDFVPYNLGAKTMIRNDWLKHNSFISNMLFETNNNELVFVADGTYCYCQKSSNYAFQRKSYSVQRSPPTSDCLFITLKECFDYPQMKLKIKSSIIL